MKSIETTTHGTAPTLAGQSTKQALSALARAVEALPTAPPFSAKGCATPHTTSAGPAQPQGAEPLIHVTHPLPGATKFEPIDHAAASRLAHEHYGSAVSHCERNADGSYSIKAYGSWKAIVGTVGGVRAILHKMDDGSRELQQYI